RSGAWSPRSIRPSISITPLIPPKISRASSAPPRHLNRISNMTKELPKTAKAVVIGGGIIGCSTAYHPGKLGWTDTVLLERKKLTSGTTFHAAGLVGQLRTSANITQLLGYSVDLYKKLEAETGLGTGWKMNGGLRLACNEERWTEVKRQATTAQ